MKTFLFFNTRSKDIVLHCMEMSKFKTCIVVKRKCKFLCNIVSSGVLLGEMCKEFAENELHNYSDSDCFLV